MIQNILLIGAFILLSITVLQVNGLITATNMVFIDNEVKICALGFAQTLMEEIIALDFDEKTTGNQRVRFPIQLTSAGEFGTDGGDSIKDDIDDYHNYSTVLNTDRIDGFQLNVEVTYANPLYPKNDILIRTFLKRVKIVVTNPKYMQNPESLTISSIVAYYK
jgi:hypothetical protein